MWKHLLVFLSSEDTIDPDQILSPNEQKFRPKPTRIFIIIVPSSTLFLYLLVTFCSATCLKFCLISAERLLAFLEQPSSYEHLMNISGFTQTTKLLNNYLNDNKVLAVPSHSPEVLQRHFGWHRKGMCE